MTHYHFIGIGGAGMSALADALLDLGDSVSGSDAVASDATRELAARGARVFIGHHAANLGDAEKVVLTGAVPPDNPELVAARRRGLPIIKRAKLLGQLMDGKQGVAVAGTHGKTTTSAMIAWVLSRVGRDPSYMIGGTVRGLGPGGHWGSGPELVAEADEYDRSFLHLRPQVAVITNIENDHLEYYGTEQAIFEAFEQFACNTKPSGLLIYCGDDASAAALATKLREAGVSFRMQAYGALSAAVEWSPRDVRVNNAGGSDYVALRNGGEVARVSLKVPGLHNVLNSLAALVACVELGVDAQEAANRLGEYIGAGRRFEVKGSAGGVTVIDDYGHHPTEIAATLQAARQRYPHNRLVLLFQPHTYTRTRDFLHAFAHSLQNADRVLVTEIYASRERDTLGMSGQHIVWLMGNSSAGFVPTLHDAEQMLARELRPGDVLLTMGAGDVWKVGEAVLERLQEQQEEGGAPLA